MSFCKKCGYEIKDDVQFCPKCGNDLSKDNKTSNIINNLIDTKDFTQEYDVNDVNSSKGISILSYLNILFIIPLLTKPDSKFSRFHVNQGLLLFISFSALNLILNIFRGSIFFIC